MMSKQTMEPDEDLCPLAECSKSWSAHSREEQFDHFAEADARYVGWSKRGTLRRHTGRQR